MSRKKVEKTKYETLMELLQDLNFEEVARLYWEAIVGSGRDLESEIPVSIYEGIIELDEYFQEAKEAREE